MLSPSSVATALEDHGLRQPSCGELELRQAWISPRVPLIARYAEELHRELPVWWTVHHFGGGKLPWTYRQALRCGLVRYLESLDAIVMRFPRDPLLPALRLLAPDRRSELAEALSKAGLRPDLDTLRVLAHKPLRRCTVRFETSTGESYFGKFLSPETAAAQERDYRALARALHAGSHRTTVAEPIALLPGLGLLVFEEVRGQSVNELLKHRYPRHLASAVGCALADLHGAAAAWGQAHTRDREVETVARWIRGATLAASPIAGSLDDAFETLIEESRRIAPGPLLTSHRDLHDKQLLLRPGGATILDLETVCRAEPELDAANFLAHLTLRQLQQPEVDIDQAGEELLASYARARGPLATRRLLWYRKSALLRLACVYHFRPRWSHLTGTLCAEAISAGPSVRTPTNTLYGGIS